MHIITTPLRLILLFLGLFACVGLDEAVLPADAGERIAFEAFEINPEREYLLGKLVNNSPYTLTSCRFRVNIYPLPSNRTSPLELTEAKLGDSLLIGKTPVHSESFFIREMLEPGYSTEVYFELRLRDIKGSAIYTREFIELKGRIAS